MIGSQEVRKIRVLPFGSRVPSAPAPADTEPEPVVRGEIRTRETASAGYHRARRALGETPDQPAPAPVRTREDASPGYHQVLALVRAAKDRQPEAPAPARTRQDASPGYHHALAQISADPPPARPRPPIHSRDTASAGYQLTRKALLENRHRPRSDPATPPDPSPTHETPEQEAHP